MPSGKTHDLITLMLTVPMAASAYFFAPRLSMALVAGLSFLFGGLMFGPDLDTTSVQTGRWRILKPIWLPYRMFFRHRSRWTHGVVFGTALRVVYFAGIVTALAYISSVILAVIIGVGNSELSIFVKAWADLGRLARDRIGTDLVFLSLFGTWLGAAVHTLTDLAGTYIRTGRRSRII